MERNVGKGMMGQQNNYEQVGYSSVDTRNEGIGSANQRFFQDPSSSINTNIRPPDFNMPVGARPVLNFSIQTGEEFAFEFMRDRAFAKQHFIPHSTGEPSSATSYMDLKDILGISHTGSESGSDISMIASVDKSRVQDHERKSTLNEEHAFSQAAQSVSRTTSRNNDGRGVHSRITSRSSKKLKFLCSFGGRILPRPSDGKLRYVGGDTRIIHVMRDISWDEFKEKISTIYSPTHIIKYQLPGEELDALVSVSCDEDFQNMMEECNVLEDGGSQKLRMFLFSSSDMDDSQLGLENVEGDTEFQYFVAVNGMDIGSRRNSVGLASTSGNNLEELLGLSVDREQGRVVASLAAVDTMHPVGGSTNQSSHRAGSSSLHELDSNSQGYQNQTTQYNGVDWQQLSTSQPIGNFSVIDRKSTVIPSAPLSYAYGPRTSNYAQLAEDNFVLNSSHSQMTLEGGLTAPEYPFGYSHVLDTEVSASEVKLKRDASIQKRVQLGKNESLEKEPKEEKMKRENSMQKMSEPEKTRPLDYEKAVSSNPYDNSTSNNSSRVEEQISGAAAVMGNSVVPSKGSAKNQDQIQSSVSPESDKEERIDAFNEDSHLIASSKVSKSGHGNSEAYPFDFNSEPSTVPPTVPPRLFRSERIPREQVGLNRLSKSDDSSASPFLMTHSQSEGSQHMSESIDKFPDKNEASETKHFISSNLSSNQPAGEDKTVEFQKCEEVADNAKVVGSQISKDGGKMNIQNVELKATVLPDRDTSQPSLSITSGNFHNESASKTTENVSDDNNAMGEVKSLAGREQLSGAASQVKPSVNEHGDILIDINDRFPRDFLSDIFSKAADGSAGVAPLHGDGGGLSLNMENHEPKHWSFFKKLAQDDFVRRDVSLMDQDHPSFPTTSAHVDEVSMDYSYPNSKLSGVVMDSHINIQADIHQQSPQITEPLTMNLPSDYNPSQVSGIQSMQSDGTINRKTPDSVYQVLNYTCGTKISVCLSVFFFQVSTYTNIPSTPHPPSATL